MSTFISRIPARGGGVRVAVKDLIDVRGIPTTAACKAVADGAAAASSDAACLAGTREAEAGGRARLVGKTNLHELAFGATGINPQFGTPVNPLDAARIPGGSSSGSAVAVAEGEADVAFGTDTGGSVRIPSACCGTVGLKTTQGRIPLEGVMPLSPSLDTVGPMAADVAGVGAGMALLEADFEQAGEAPTVVGRYRPGRVDPRIDLAVDAALAAAGLEVKDVRLPGWDDAYAHGGAIIIAEAWAGLHHLLKRRYLMGEMTAARIESGRQVDAATLLAARDARERWRAELDAVFEQVQVIALPAMRVLTPLIEGVEELSLTGLTMPVNLAGMPALCLPVPAGAPLPASLQLIGPDRSEDLLLALGRVVEAAVA